MGMASSHSKIASLPLGTSLLLPPAPMSIPHFIPHPRQLSQLAPLVPSHQQISMATALGTGRRRLSWTETCLLLLPPSRAANGQAGAVPAPQVGECAPASLCFLLSGHHRPRSPGILADAPCTKALRLALLSHPPKISTQWVSLANC